MRYRKLVGCAAVMLALTLASPGLVFAQPAPPPPSPSLDPEDLLERSEAFEVEDPDEATRIGNELAAEAAAQAGPGARALAEPGCYNDRFRSCKTYGAVITQVVIPRPGAPEEVIGIWKVDMTIQVTSQLQNVASTVGFIGRVSVQYGSPIAGTFTMNVSAQKPGQNFGQPIGAPVTFPLSAGTLKTHTYPQVFSPVTVDDNTWSTFLTYDWTNTTPVPQQYPPPGTQITTQRIRCDSAPYLQKGSGCVNPSYKPIIGFPSYIYPYISQNIQNGQQNGLGAPGIEPLRRGTPGDTTNRDAACTTANRNKLGTPDPAIIDPECDEYPFNSSLEGGSLATVAWVPRSENQLQAQRIREFYSAYRLMTYDDFYVQP
ncbi:hypothetical protein CH263_20230 [Rhodococcus sp. 06-1059B-a]|nr:NucA/NucB deoxyribonuclease domain-containing protein [Rhodococcus sp. 06-1059B-a]OZD60820.1 hypothetical protein CH263_20230 [Rhodococcus sp. 06-1059B-a]